FRPTNPISRQAMAAFLTRYAADDEPDACEGDGPFTDVPATHPFCAEITWMVDQGITTGFDDNTFRPTSPISRQAAAAFLWRLAGEPTGATIRVSVSSKGQQASGLSGGSAISADGSTAAFASFAADLVDDDTNSAGDVFVHDLTTGETTRVSVASDGTQANGDSGHPSLSADGRYVAFHSEATNLANGAQSGDYQIYVHDRETRTTELVSVAGNGDGGNGASLGPIISADGRFVVFESRADNLVDDDKNGARDVFVRDRASGETEMISRTPDGLPADGESWLGSMSADGRFVTYVTAATDIVKGEDTFGHAVLHDRDSGTATLLSQSIDGTPAEPGSYSNAAGISADGSVVVFWSDASNLVPGEDNGDFDVYVLDQRANTLDRISVAPDGTPADAGSFTAWASVSGDGRFVAFASTATNLTPDVAGAPTGSHAYVHDRATGTTTLVSATPDGGWANDSTGETGLAFDHDGRLVAFSSTASDLVPNDTNSQVDVFVRTRYGVG
ncbi:MAG: PD40 domain-containing protein, partial [Acidimicrobiia bacterium]|nr:PD40 domain-containing protein [Acidimicrobiia bacterium]